MMNGNFHKKIERRIKKSRWVGWKRLAEACFGNSLSITEEFDLRSQILVHPSLPQLASVGPGVFDVACRLAERMEDVPPG